MMREEQEPRRRENPLRHIIRLIVDFIFLRYCRNERH